MGVNELVSVVKLLKLLGEGEAEGDGGGGSGSGSGRGEKGGEDGARALYGPNDRGVLVEFDNLVYMDAPWLVSR